MHLAAQQASERAQRLAALIVRRPWSILAVALIVGVAALWLALGLRVDQQLRALLPDDAISTTRIDAMSERLGNQSDLYVEIRSPSREANLRFGERFAAELRQRADLRHVHFHLSRDFFEENALLYAELADLLDLRCRVIEAVQAQVRREMALLGDDDDPVPQLSEPELRERYQRGARLPEYYEADEGRVVVIKARPTRPDTDIAFARALSRELAAAAAAAEPAAYHPDMVVEIEGAYAEHTRKVSGLEGDIVRGSAIVFGLLMLSLAVYFRGLRAIVLVLLPLAIAILTALAAARLFYGALNLVSAFIFAVLLGLGVDFGIHILARYQAERRRGLALTPALALTFTTTGLSTAAGALSTALTCFLLLVADFRGFSHFGVIAGLGVTLSLVGAVLVLPAALVVLERRWPWRTTQRPPPEPPPAAAAEQTPAPLPAARRGHRRPRRRRRGARRQQPRSARARDRPRPPRGPRPRRPGPAEQGPARRLPRRCRRQRARAGRRARRRSPRGARRLPAARRPRPPRRRRGRGARPRRRAPAAAPARRVRPPGARRPRRPRRRGGARRR